MEPLPPRPRQQRRRPRHARRATTLDPVGTPARAGAAATRNWPAPASVSPTTAACSSSSTRPRWRRSASRGRWHLVARDAFNGKLLWKQTDPHLDRPPAPFPVRPGPPAAPAGGGRRRRLRHPRPGRTRDRPRRRHRRSPPPSQGTEHTEEILVQDGILYLVVGTGEVERKGEGLHTRDEPEPTPFRFIAAVDAKSGKTLWKQELRALRLPPPAQPDGARQQRLLPDHQRDDAPRRRIRRRRLEDPAQHPGQPDGIRGAHRGRHR